MSNLPLKSIVSSLICSDGILQISRFPGNNGPANKISVTRGWFLTETMVLCGLSERDSQVPSFLVLIDGFQSRDKTTMLLHKTIASYGLCFCILIRSNTANTLFSFFLYANRAAMASGENRILLDK